MEIKIIMFKGVLVTYGTGSNPVTPPGWISRKRRERSDGKKEENKFRINGNCFCFVC